MPKSIVLVQTSMGDYRDKFVESLTSDTEQYNFTLYVGDYYYGKTTYTSKFISNHRARKRTLNILIGSKVGIQLFNYIDACKKDVVVLELNPRIINTWLILVSRKIMKKRTVLWGHVWNRKHVSGDAMPKVRLAQMRLSSGLLLYTYPQKAELLEIGLGFKEKNVFVAPNALYSKDEMGSTVAEHADSFIYVGRCVDSKKPFLLIKAFYAALVNLPRTSKLHIVGRGPLLAPMKKYVEERNISDRIVFHGHVGDTQTLRNLYSECIASVSPGYLGLSAIQSFSFGRPIIVSRDEPHAPEIDALKVAENGVFFETDSTAALTQTILNFSRDKALWRSRFEKISNECESTYSTEAMVEGFLSAVR